MDSKKLLQLLPSLSARLFHGRETSSIVSSSSAPAYKLLVWVVPGKTYRTDELTRPSQHFASQCDGELAAGITTAAVVSVASVLKNP